MNPLLLRIAGLSTGKAVVIGAIVTLAYYQLAYDDGSKYQSAITRQGKELAEEREKEKATDIALQRRNHLESSYKSLSEQFQIVSAQIPADLDSAEVIRTVDTMAKTSGVTIKSKEPKAAQRQDILEIYPIRVVAEGSYAEMTMFFFNLSTIERVYRVKSFSFQTPTDRRGAKASTKMTMDAEITSFKFVGPQPEDPKKPKAPPRPANRRSSSK